MRNNEIKSLLAKFNISIQEACNSTEIPFRTFFRYYADENYGSDVKRAYIISKLRDIYEITEEKGILSLNEIKSTCLKVFEPYKDKITSCILFGSYAKGNATDKSDIDLLIDTDLIGLDYVGLIEELRVALHKKIDLLRLLDNMGNFELLKDIMKDGVRIYEQHKR